MATVDTICRNYNMSRSGLNTEIKYNLNSDRTLKYFRLGCFNCNGYDKSCENYKSQDLDNKDFKIDNKDFRYETMAV